MTPHLTRQKKILQRLDKNSSIPGLQICLSETLSGAEVKAGAVRDALGLPVRHVCSSTHRVLSLILTAAASLALDALPPQSLHSHRELWGEL